MSRSSQYMPAIVLSLLAALAVAVDAWLLLGEPKTREFVLLVLGIQFLLMLGAIWALAAIMALRVVRPLGRIRDHLRAMLHTDAGHRLGPLPAHGLGELPDLVEELGRRLYSERLESARAIEAATARLERRRSCLEAILRDLHEGVVVCNDDHRVVLFNQSAAAALEPAGPVGLHRPVTGLFHGTRLRREYALLRWHHDRGAQSAPVAFFRERTLDGRQLEMRMSLIVDHGEIGTGYVVSFSPDKPQDREAGRRLSPGILSERPEFYDFSLFDTARGGRMLDRYLDELDYVVFDTETTGLHRSHGDELVQISGVRLVRGRLTGEEFNTLVNPAMPIPASSMRFHGISDDMVAGAPPPAEAIRLFSVFAEGAVLVAHNAAFDMEFLTAREPEGGTTFELPVLDTLLLSLVLQPDHSVHTLEAVAARFGVDISDDARHTALGDARAAAETFVKMLPLLRRRGPAKLGELLQACERVSRSRAKR